MCMLSTILAAGIGIMEASRACMGPYHISLSPGVACITEALHLLQQACEVRDGEGQGCFSSRDADICLTVLGSMLGGAPPCKSGRIGIYK